MTEPTTVDSRSDDPRSSGAPLPGPRRWLAFGLVFVALTAFGLRGLPSEAADAPAELLKLLFVWPAPALLGLLLVLYFTADTMRLHYTLAALGHRLPWRSLIQVAFVNFFVSNLTPLATGGGLAQVWFLNRRGVPIGAATAATSLRTLLAAAMIFGAVPFALLRVRRLHSWPWTGELLTGLAVVGLLSLLGLLLVLRRPGWLLALGSNLLGSAHKAGVIGEVRHLRWQRSLRRETLRFARASRVYAYGGRRRELALATVATLIFLVTLFSFPAALVVALGYRAPYLDLLGLMTLTTALLYVAPTPGAAGIAESVFGRLLYGSVATEVLPFLTLAWRALTIYLGMILGLGVILRELAGNRPPVEGVPSVESVPSVSEAADVLVASVDEVDR